jgi:hypothetical protein
MNTQIESPTVSGEINGTPPAISDWANETPPITPPAVSAGSPKPILTFWGDSHMGPRYGVPAKVLRVVGTRFEAPVQNLSVGGGRMDEEFVNSFRAEVKKYEGRPQVHLLLIGGNNMRSEQCLLIPENKLARAKQVQQGLLAALACLFPSTSRHYSGPRLIIQRHPDSRNWHGRAGLPLRGASGSSPGRCQLLGGHLRAHSGPDVAGF